MNAQPPYFARRSDEDEYLRDFQRREPLLGRLSRERWRSAALNLRFLGRRSLSHLALRLRKPRQGEK